MLRKIIDNLSYAGFVALLAGYLYYSLTNEWTAGVQAAFYGGLGLLGIALVIRIPRIIGALGTRGGKQGTLALTSLLLVLGIVGLANFLNYRHHERFDLSEGGLNTLAEQSLKVVQNLTADVKLIGFYTSPSAAREFQDLASEYSYVSNRLTYEVIDPQKDPAKVPIYKIERDGEIVVESGSRNQKVDQLSEEKITNAIIKVLREQQKVIYFLQGHGERGVTDSEPNGYLVVSEAVQRQNYRVESFTLAVEEKVPEDAALLVIAGPTGNLLPNEVAALKDYLRRNGKLLLMVDPQTRFSMNDFLAEYGIRLDGNVIVDAGTLGQLLGLGPASPLVNSYNRHPITEELKSTTFFPFAQGISEVESSLAYQTTTLFSSSGRSWGETTLSEGQEVSFDPTEDARGPLAMAVAAVRSEAQGEEGEEESSGDDSSRPESRVVVIGDSDFVANQYVDISGGNLDLFLNTVSWLAQDEDLIAVRPKDPTNRQVNLTERDSRLIFWASVILLPALTLLVGFSIWYRRR